MSCCSLTQLTAQVLENKDIGFGMVDSQKDVKVAKKLGMYCICVALGLSTPMGFLYHFTSNVLF